VLAPKRSLSPARSCTAYDTELASSDVSVYTLMKLLGHESMTTSQRYVSAAGAETRSAAARNPIYAMIPSGGEAPAN
jgi:integrase/recombinase XerC